MTVIKKMKKGSPDVKTLGFLFLMYDRWQPVNYPNHCKSWSVIAQTILCRFHRDG